METIAGVRVGKYNLGTRASKCKVSVRVGKHKLGARACRYKLGARTGKCKLGTRAGKYKLGTRARVRGQAKGRGPGNTKTHFDMPF